MATAVLATSGLASGFAIAFRGLLHLAYWLADRTDNAVAMLEGLPVWARVLLPAVGGLLAGFVARYLAKKPGGGVGDVMEAVVMGRSRMPLSVTLWKSVASYFALITGGSIGREGPMMQMGGATGSKVGEWLKMDDPSRRVLIAAGCGAGFAAAYNTPFAAVLFVLEVVTGVVVIDAVVPTLVAVALSTALSRLTLGAGPIYHQRFFSLGSTWELFAFAGLGLAAAVGAQGFMRLLALGERLFHHPKLRRPWRTALGGALAGGVAAFLPQVAGNGYEPLNQLLDAKLTLGFVALLLLGKSFATVSSVSSGSPGGVFTPTLMLGGGLGFLYAHALTALGLKLGPAGGYALVGMAAAAAATTHAPVMAAVMVFELSGDYAVVLPLVLCTALATGLSRAIRRESLYMSEVSKRGVAWELTLEGRKMVEPEPD
jgi:CIC family chloride channel protein